MDLLNVLTKPNELNEELNAKVELYRNDPFSAKIRPEYILFVKQIRNEEKQEDKRQLNSDEYEEQRQVKKIKSTTETSEESNQKIEKQIAKKSTKEIKLCPLFGEGKKCDYGDSCKYSHNLKEWLESKPKNIHDLCYLFGTYGYCSFGITCRFNNKHIIYRDDSFENVINIERFPNLSNSLNLSKIYKIENALPFELKNKLWKRKYDFGKANRVHKIVSDYINSNGLANVKYNQHKGIVNKQNTSDNMSKNDSLNNVADQQVQNDQEKPHDTINEPVSKERKTGFVSDEDLIKLRPVEKKTIDWKDKLYLAPLTTLGNLPFRRIAKEFGADITCSEMAMCTNLLSGNASEWALLKRHESETLFGVQLAGSHADSLCKASQIINENFNVDFIDINSGCPIDLVFNKGSGCALMTRLDHFQRIIRSLDTLLDIPVTAKIRTGIKDDTLIAHDIVPSLKSWGASMITLHGRTRQQRYSKLADWDYIDHCAKLCAPVPLFGCGDILSYQDYYEHMENTNISGCMIARGALYKPWLFTEIKERRDWDISAGERFDMLKRFTNYGLEHWGSDTRGVETTRRFLLEWLSFLYRYIPVGIMEHLPQRINLRPPLFFGRNELETLMASPSSSDWIKISEFLLGPVPDGFRFEPKHKANAY